MWESGDMAQSGSDNGSDASGVASAARTDRVQRYNGGRARARAFAHFRAFRAFRFQGGADRPTVRGRPVTAGGGASLTGAPSKDAA